MIRPSNLLESRALATGVLIIGGGGAAYRAALAAHDAGADVLLVQKGNLGKSGSTAYGVAEMAGFNVPDGVADPDDCPEEHLKDILEAGLGMADERLARLLAEGAVRVKDELESWGVNFERTSAGRYLSVQSCFSSRPRTHIIRGHGEPIIKALLEQIRRRGIKIVENMMVTDLLIRDGICAGAVAIRQDYPEALILRAGAVIVATGGAGQLFKVTLNPPDITGDGHAIAYRAGAEMVNMEFMQAAVGFIHPVKNIFNAWLWGVYPLIANRDGKSFLEDYLRPGLGARQVMSEKTHYPFSCRDNSKYLEIAIQKELARGGGTEHGGVIIDFRHTDEKDLMRLPVGHTVREMWPITRDWMLRRGIDIRKVPLEISNFGHALNGGIRIDERTRSTLPGLFAAGEVAGGPHGADRLGGNMMVTCQVFGRMAGEEAAAFAEKHSEITLSGVSAQEQIDKLKQKMGQKGTNRPETLKRELAEVMYDNLLVVRSAASLERASAGIRNLRQTIQKVKVAGDIKSLTGLLELENLMTVSEMIVEAARYRKESRGSHYREDFPEAGKDFDRPAFIQPSDEGPMLRLAPFS